MLVVLQTRYNPAGMVIDGVKKCSWCEWEQETGESESILMTHKWDRVEGLTLISSRWV